MGYFENTHRIIKETPLKRLDSALLAITLIDESTAAGMSHKVREAMSLASHLHSQQTRANRGNLPRTPYIEHPLRNAIRLFRWGCINEEIIIAAILHDVVEDCSLKFVKDYTNLNIVDEMEARHVLLEYIANEFSPEVSRIVEAVSNDILPREMPKLKKQAIYRLHVAKAIHADTAVFLVKFSDFADNASSLHHNDAPEHKARTKSMATKYRPLVDVFLKEFENIEKVLISAEGEDSILKLLGVTKERLELLLQ